MLQDCMVTPCVGVWIETAIERLALVIEKSHPAWVCGLKQLLPERYSYTGTVTPCVGVWIETFVLRIYIASKLVTPCVGVWIETMNSEKNSSNRSSHTLRGCVD